MLKDFPPLNEGKRIILGDFGYLKSFAKCVPVWFLFKKQFMYCMCIPVYTHVYMCEGQRQLSGFGFPLPPCGIQYHSSLGHGGK